MINISIHTILTSIIYFTLAIIILKLLIINDSLLKFFNIKALLLVVFLILIRVLVPVQFLNSNIIESKLILTQFFDLLRIELFHIMDFKIQLIDLIFINMLLGVFIGFINNIKNWKTLRKTLSNMKLVKNDEISHLFSELLEENNIDSDVKLIISNDIRDPFSIDIFNFKRIYIPDYKFSKKYIKMILSHEINHIKNKDGLKKLLFLLVKTLFWWNPFIYILEKSIIQLIEINCDRSTTKNFSNDQKITYLESFKQALNHGRAFENYDNNLNYFVLEDSKFNLKQRIEMISNHRSNQKKTTRVLQYILVVVIFISSYVFMLQPSYDAPEDNYVNISSQESSFVMFDREDELYYIFIDNRLYKNMDEKRFKNSKYKDLNIYEMDIE